MKKVVFAPAVMVGNWMNGVMKGFAKGLVRVMPAALGLLWATSAAGQFTIDGNGMITAYSGPSGEVALPKMVDTIWVRSIGPSVFANDTTLTRVVISDSSVLISIGASAFKGCTELTQINLPDRWATASTGVRTIGESAFDSCTALWLAELPASLESLGKRAFANCGLLSVTVPGGVATISEEAFTGCTLLNELVINNGVSAIGDSAFAGCTQLSVVTIGPGVASVGQSAFSGCSALTTVHIQRATPPTLNNLAFSDVPLASAVLFVPTLADKAAYQKDTGWNDFGTILAEGEVPIPSDSIAVRLDLIVHNTDTFRRDTTWISVGDTSWITVGDTSYVYIYINDTFYIPPVKTDTIWQYDSLYDTLSITLYDTLRTRDTVATIVWRHDTVRISRRDTTITTQIVHDTVEIHTPYEAVVVIDANTGVEYNVEGDYLQIVSQSGEDMYLIRGLQTGKQFAIYNSAGEFIYRGTVQPVHIPGSGLFVLEQSGTWRKFKL